MNNLSHNTTHWQLLVRTSSKHVASESRSFPMLKHLQNIYKQLSINPRLFLNMRKAVPNSCKTNPSNFQTFVNKHQKIPNMFKHFQTTVYPNSFQTCPNNYQMFQRNSQHVQTTMIPKHVQTILKYPKEIRSISKQTPNNFQTLKKECPHSQTLGTRSRPHFADSQPASATSALRFAQNERSCKRTNKSTKARKQR